MHENWQNILVAAQLQKMEVHFTLNVSSFYGCGFTLKYIAGNFFLKLLKLK